MLLYLTTEENNAVLDKAADEQGIQISKHIGTFNLLDFVQYEQANLNYVKYLAIDLAALDSSSKETIAGIVSFKTMYNARIVIVAVGHEAGEMLLSDMFAEGVYDFITAVKLNDQYTQAVKALSEGSTYQDALQFRVEPDTRKNRLFNFGVQEKVVVKETKEKIRQKITIGVIGTQSRIGTTTQALLIARYLVDNGYKACYVNTTNDTSIAIMIDLYDLREQKEDEWFEISGLRVYYNNSCITEALNQDYDFIVFDDGYNTGNLANFLMRDVKIVVSGGKAWECPALAQMFPLIENTKDKINFVFSFIDESEKKSIKQLMGAYKDATYFSEYACLPYSKSANNSIYQTILKDYIEPEQVNRKTPRFKLFGL